jgi:hypothetical protein
MTIPLNFPQSVDSTMLNAFTSCPRKFFYEFLLRKVPEGRSIDLHAGGCYASALEVVRNLVYQHQLPLNDALPEAWKVFAHQWGDFTEPEGHAKSFVNMWNAVEYYFTVWPPETDHIQPLFRGDGRPATEFTFGIPTHVNHPVSGHPILYSGRFDLLGHDLLSGLVFPLDDKTTKSMGSDWAQQWTMRGQFHGYAFAAREMGYSADGCIARGVCIQKTQYKSEEAAILFTNHQLDMWWRNANRRIEQMVERWEQAAELIERFDLAQADPGMVHSCLVEPFELSYGDACMAYFRPCMFTQLCTDNAPWTIYTDWDTRVWNPLAKDPTEDSTDRMLDSAPVETPDELMRLLKR